MKIGFLRMAALVAVICGLFSVSEALASGENEVKFTATVEALPGNGFVGDWTVGGRTVRVTGSTEINQEDGRIVVGSTVKVEGRQRSDGSVDASEIELREGNSGGGSGSGSGGSGSGDSGSGSSGSGNNGADDVKFKGTIENFPTGLIGDWRIGGRTVHVTSSTRIEQELGPVAVGAFSEVKGALRADGSMDATKVEIKSNVAGGDGRDELKGIIQSLPNTLNFIGDWTVGGRAVHVTASTIINREHGSVAVGVFVEVNGTQRADGSIDASRIEVKTSVDSSDGDNKNVKGAIESLPNTVGLIGDWTIGGRIVHVISSTRLKTEHGAFAVGVRVKVKGIQMADGSVVATKIQARDSN
jgi:uncharacterized protein DUF5666